MKTFIKRAAIGGATLLALFSIAVMLHSLNLITEAAFASPLLAGLFTKT